MRKDREYAQPTMEVLMLENMDIVRTSLDDGGFSDSDSTPYGSY